MFPSPLERRETYVSAHGDQLDPRTESLILEGKVTPGMTMEQVRASWGDPSRVNSSIGSWGRREQWVYRSPRAYASRSYLYFMNGELESIQQSN